MPPPMTAAPAPSDDDLLTKLQVANHYKVTTRTVKRWSDQGILKALKMTRSTVRFRRGDLPTTDKIEPTK